ncbi:MULTISPECIES: alpha-ketoglutarate dehydrogenase [unclassified Pseudomonas]|uniref:alpha-ketoglutarate dehydrogenase n=1 Tax=unclassified Pseudomonas TaxID=196821 RepID=UPI00244BB7B2|nr:MULTISPECIES: alpha-ketoglutarate dehydrogenase [unclassified Pseudomonas]MDH0302982.1 alpha-ketoglutarate dehydrogenase [Pseudomonas sp. GD04091]MDH1988367.1 alpha-ketoglutarate dehydrogenase [Pseudomonas sp. GD03689]
MVAMMKPNEPLTALDAVLDSDPAETAEWCQALESTLAHCGPARARYLLQRLHAHALELGLERDAQAFSAYRNTLPVEQQGAYPGDLELDERITAILRWNALAMVVRANHAYGELGGHIASYASAAEIFEVGFQHFFRGERGMARRTADLVFFQPHSAPGIYARAFLEGRLSEEQLANYRQEVAGNGLCSYPHPWLMPDFWQFPTGSMGIGPLNAIYQARFMRYLQHRGLLDTSDRHVWGVFGDGEMDEPESTAGLTLAAREGLDNLTFIVNCNLQRLDGPVRGNGQIIQELEALFSGAGWNVIKVLWGSEWDALFARDHEHALLRQLAATPDGQFQTLGAKDGRYNLEHFFNQSPALQQLVAHMSAEQINALKRGGHDFRKLHAAYAAAKACKGRPTVILAKTKKGYGMSAAGESRMTAHQAKKLDVQALLAFRDRFHLPLSDEAVEQLRFYRPAEDSPEMVYLRQRREALDGPLPMRRSDCASLPVPDLDTFAGFALRAEHKEMSTTMAAVRLLGNWLKAPGLGPRVVPIVADEARTFGMASLFRQIGIYSPQGQCYEPEDAGSLLVYKESRDGQLLEEGITEAGAISSWIAAATAYAMHGEPMLPVYIYYSMFGFQRVGDLIWAAADQRARGLLLGATAGRTTLGGEGLQHQDGSSLVMAAMVPNCRAWDPCFAGELAVILDHAARRMLVEQRDEFHYVAVMNENYPQPSLPDEVREDVLQGMYRYTRQQAASPRAEVRLLGSGTILREVIAAGELLSSDWQVDCEVFSVTSFSELARGARDADRTGMAGGDAECHLRRCLSGGAPVIAASDYVRAWPQLIAEYVNAPFISLGTDGFGRSDTRRQLRRFFEVDRHAVVMAALYGLVRQGVLPADVLEQARGRYGIGEEGAAWYR